MISNCAHCVHNAGRPHTPCVARCPCQHGRPYEMSPLPEGFAGYLDGLPPDDPRRVRMAQETGHATPPAPR